MVSNNVKGIILAGGTGSRLYPMTKVVNKQLLPVYDKPMIYYPLSILMEAGIKDILVITAYNQSKIFEELLGDGSNFGINITYKEQIYPNGLAEAFIIGEDFIGKNSCSMILGDNIFYGSGLKDKLIEAKENLKLGKATIFGCEVKDPSRFGVMELDNMGNILSVEEKPEIPKSNYAVTGLYFYPSGVSDLAKEVKPSKRNELEITTLNEMYLKQKLLKGILLNDGYTWFDTGTFDSLLYASNMIKSIENNKETLIGSPELIAYKNNLITKEQLYSLALKQDKNSYGKILIKTIGGI